MNPPTQRITSNPTEADTCRQYVVPKLQAAGWDSEPHSIAEQRTFTNGRDRRRRDEGETIRAQEIRLPAPLHARFHDCVVEAKAEHKLPADGLQTGQGLRSDSWSQVRLLDQRQRHRGVRFHDWQRSRASAVPTPAELWGRLSAHNGLNEEQTKRLLTPYNTFGTAHATLLPGDRNQSSRPVDPAKASPGTFSHSPQEPEKRPSRFQICWKLWSSGWNRTGGFGKPRILFLADRNILVDKPKEEDFAPFGDARMKIEGGVANKSRQMYFAIYQSLAKDEAATGPVSGVRPRLLRPHHRG